MREKIARSAENRAGGGATDANGENRVTTPKRSDSKDTRRTDGTSGVAAGPDDALAVRRGEAQSSAAMSTVVTNRSSTDPAWQGQGNALHRARTRAGISSQAELARLAGVDPRIVRRLERRQAPVIAIYLALAAALEIDVTGLFDSFPGP
jgi:hypothetical protein